MTINIDSQALRVLRVDVGAAVDEFTDEGLCVLFSQRSLCLPNEVESGLEGVGAGGVDVTTVRQEEGSGGSVSCNG